MSKPTHEEALERLDCQTINSNHNYMIDWCDKEAVRLGRPLTDVEAVEGLMAKFEIHTEWLVVDWITCTYVPVEGSPE